MLAKSQLHEAHEHSVSNRVAINKSGWCGCFSCCQVYPAEEVQDWTDKGETALCPKCNIDSIIGDASGLSLNMQLLRQMQRQFFSNIDTVPISDYHKESLEQ